MAPGGRENRIKLPLAFQFAIGNVLSLVLAIIVISVILGSIGQVVDAVGEASRNRNLIDAAQDFQHDLVNAETAQRGFIITGRAEFLQPYEEMMRRFDAVLQRMRDLADDDETRTIVDNLARAGRNVLNGIDESVATRRTLGFEAAASRVDAGDGKRRMDNVRTLVSQFNEMQDQRLRTARGLVTDAVQRAWIAAIIGFGAAILGSIVAGWWVSHRVRERLMGLNRSMDRIGAGDLEHRAPEGGNDEVTGMARAVNAMAARIEESNKALDSFAYTVSHDLRAPLRALEGFSRAVQEDYADRLDDEGRDYLRRMVDAAQRMDQLINDLLAYSRLSRADVQMETVSLEEVVDLCVAELKADPQTRCADVVVDRPLPSALASRTILRQAIANLLTNAAKFVAAGITPRIAIKAHAADGRVRLEIADNGIGMAAEHLGRIFKVFERLHGGEAYPGTGIGLAIVEKGVQRMGGAVGVASRPGAGSRFWIELQQGKES